MQRALVERAMAGDRAAFTEPGRDSMDRMHTIARLILSDVARARAHAHAHAHAHEATEEALISALRDIKGLRDPDKFGPWIRRLLVNACSRGARKA